MCVTCRYKNGCVGDWSQSELWRWGGKSALGTRLEWEEPARADLFPVISNRRENFSTLKLYLINCVCYEFLQFFFLLRHQF